MKRRLIVLALAGSAFAGLFTGVAAPGASADASPICVVFSDSPPPTHWSGYCVWGPWPILF